MNTWRVIAACPKSRTWLPDGRIQSLCRDRSMSDYMAESLSSQHLSWRGITPRMTLVCGGHFFLPMCEEADPLLMQ